MKHNAAIQIPQRLFAGAIILLCLATLSACSLQGGSQRVDHRPLEPPMLSGWRSPTGAWTETGEVFMDPENERRLAWDAGRGAIVNGAGGSTANIFSRVEHGNVEAHIEFMVPKGSNSGVYFMGRYEIQVLDSWGVEKPSSSDCGGIYQRWRNGVGFEGRPPSVNASRPPGEWQTLDVVFKAPQFDGNGNKVANAVFVEVRHNGTLVHKNEEVTGPTRAAGFEDEVPTGPLMLQGDHGPVAYRNIRLRLIENDRDRAVQEALNTQRMQHIAMHQFGESREDEEVVRAALRIVTPEQQPWVEDRLLGILESPNATLDGRNLALRLLRQVGSSRCLPVVEPLLTDPEQSDMARYCLEAIEGRTVTKALASALHQVCRNSRSPETAPTAIGLIETLGRRGDSRSIGVLGNFLSSADESMAAASIDAVARIGGARAVRALARAEVPDSLRARRDMARVACLEAMLARDPSDGVRRQLSELMGEAGSPAACLAACRALGSLEDDGVAPAMLQWLEGDNAELRLGACRLLGEFPPCALEENELRVNVGFADRIARVEPATRAALIEALGRRAHPEAVPKVLATIWSDDPTVRLAAIRALGRMGDVRGVRSLARAATEGGEVGRTAAEALILCNGPGVDLALVETSENATTATRVVAVEALASRDQTDAAPSVLRTAGEDSPPAVRIAALEALAVLARAEEFAPLVDYLLDPPDEEARAAAVRAASRTALRLGPSSAETDCLLAAGERVLDTPTRCALLEVYGALSSEALLGKTREALQHPTPQVRAKAVEALSEWKTTDPMDDLLRLARNADDDVSRSRARRGYLRMLGERFGAEPVDIEAVRTAFGQGREVAETPEEKRLLIASAAKVTHGWALEFLADLAADSDVGEEAAAAANRLRDSLGRMVEHGAVGASVSYREPYAPQYTGGGDGALTDGLRGSASPGDGRWQGFHGIDFEATVDLGKTLTVHEVSVGFMENTGSWIFLPLEVEVTVCGEGQNFEPVGRVAWEAPAEGRPTATTSATIELDGVEARFVQVRARNMQTCPDWHPGRGSQAWVFVDEIMVNPAQ